MPLALVLISPQNQTMSHIWSRGYNDGYTPSNEITKQHPKFEVPPSNQGSYVVLISKSTHTQQFPTSPGDTFRMKRHDIGEVRGPRQISDILIYPDDSIHIKWKSSLGEDRTLDHCFTREHPAFQIEATRRSSVWLQSHEQGERHVADLRPDDELEVRRVTIWDLERERSHARGSYTVETLDPGDKVWYKQVLQNAAPRDGPSTFRPASDSRVRGSRGPQGSSFGVAG